MIEPKAGTAGACGGDDGVFKLFVARGSNLLCSTLSGSCPFLVPNRSLVSSRSSRRPAGERVRGVEVFVVLLL